MRVAVLGAGVSGLAAARAFTALGDDVVVYESAPDIGGVWSATRRYPGVSTQNDKRSYAFSDEPMPEDYPEYPSGEQVQRYLQRYAERRGLTDRIRLRTRVVRTEPLPAGDGWTVVAEGPLGTTRTTVDWLVVANGICSVPHVPAWPGRDRFEAAGGAVLPPSALSSVARVRDRDVLVVGWGKSAADVAVATLPEARSVTMAARGIGWKVPKRIGRLSYQRLVLTRLGEHVLWAPHRSLAARLLQRLDAPLRAAVVRRLERQVREQLELDRRGLVPTSSVTDFTHLVTPGLFEAIDSGALRLARDASVAELTVADGRPAARLTDGRVLPADVVLAATGFEQDLGVFGEGTREALLDADGDLVLLRHTLPERVGRLAFVGWMNSFRSPIGAEVQSVWVAAHAHGLVQRTRAARRPARFRLTHAAAAARAVPQFSTGASILDLDEWVEEAGLRIPWRTRLAEVVRPLDPSDYADLLRQLQRRLAAAGASGGRAPAIERPVPVLVGTVDEAGAL